MGLYSRYIFPHVLDFVTANPAMHRCRRTLLADVQGEILEIGFGTGRNLEHYPDQVKRLTTVDVNPGMATRARRRADRRGITLDSRIVTAERLPFDNDRFDVVVSTWTLCSIPLVDQALDEVRRVLKPSGRFVFVEHGASPDPEVRRWQDRLTPWCKPLGDGCHLNRNIDTIVARHLRIDRLEQFYLDRVPRVGGYTFHGSASKA